MQILVVVEIYSPNDENDMNMESTGAILVRLIVYLIWLAWKIARTKFITPF